MTLSSKGLGIMSVEIRSVFRLNTGDLVDLVVFDKGCFELISKKESASGKNLQVF